MLVVGNLWLCYNVLQAKGGTVYRAAWVGVIACVCVCGWGGEWWMEDGGMGDGGLGRRSCLCACVSAPSALNSTRLDSTRRSSVPVAVAVSVVAVLAGVVERGEFGAERGEVWGCERRWRECGGVAEGGFIAVG